MRTVIFAIMALALPLAGAAAQAPVQQPTEAQQAAIRSACRADGVAHCSSAPAGAGRLECMRKNEAKLSATCRSALLRANLL